MLVSTLLVVTSLAPKFIIDFTEVLDTVKFVAVMYKTKGRINA
jgi:hypothetical protein